METVKFKTDFDPRVSKNEHKNVGADEKNMGFFSKTSILLYFKPSITLVLLKVDLRN